MKAAGTPAAKSGAGQLVDPALRALARPSPGPDSWSTRPSGLHGAGPGRAARGLCRTPPSRAPGQGEAGRPADRPTDRPTDVSSSLPPREGGLLVDLRPREEEEGRWHAATPPWEREARAPREGPAAARPPPVPPSQPAGPARGGPRRGSGRGGRRPAVRGGSSWGGERGRSPAPRGSFPPPPPLPSPRGEGAAAAGRPRRGERKRQTLVSRADFQ